MSYKLIINLKTYSESTNKKCEKIAKACYDLRNEAKKRNVEIVLCPQAFDLKTVISEKVSCYSQHIDICSPGGNTGFVVPKNLKEIKVRGSLISHSEHILKVGHGDVLNRINIARENGLVSVVCARNVAAAKKIAKLKPDFIAVEPKELIGGDISISTANPKLISKSVAAIRNIPLLVGAGVKNKSDVKVAVELGAKGILVASGVVKARSPKKVILDLIEGFE